MNGSEILLCDIRKRKQCVVELILHIILSACSGTRIVKKFPTCNGIRKFITAFTRARHLSLSWARSSILQCLCHTKGSVHVRGLVHCFKSCKILRQEEVSSSPKPQSGGSTLVCCPRLFIQYILSYPLYQESILDSQPEDAPCYGDRDSRITEWINT